MSRHPLEARGRTVEEAVTDGLAKLGLSREQVVIDVVEPGSKGFLGLGARDALVTLTPAVDPVDAARAVVAEVLAAGGFAATVETTWDTDSRTVEVAVTGDNLGALIGRRGRTLEALETLLNVACCRTADGPRQVVLDVGGYRVRRAETLRLLAERVAETVSKTGRSVSLEPMPARERRLVHLALQDSREVATRSEGQDPVRYVVIERRPPSEQ